MAQNSKIEWCDATFNPWRGCTKVSAGCKFCYAEMLSKRNPKVLGMWGPNGTRPVAAEAYWQLPLKWNHEAQEAGVRRKVFCASLADVFEGPETCQNAEAYAGIQAARQRLFAIARDTNMLDWLFLTKRPENIPAIMSETTHHRHPHTDWWTLMQRQPIANWWFGTSVEDQETGDKRIPELLKVPTVARFLSMEPLIGAVDLRKWIGYASYEGNIPGHCVNIDGETWHKDDYQCRSCGWGYPNDPDYPNRVPGIDWIIAGGESGPNARIMDIDWARSLRDQAVGAGVAFHFKQHGEWRVMDGGCPLVRGAMFADVGNNSYLRVGKQDAGRILDGRTWDEFPTPKYYCVKGQSV